jgi:ubiquinone/menaquinone biosynthesis C-methylase UbiE
VWSVDFREDLVDSARRHLASQQIRNVELIVGDGTRGLPRDAPFDAIVAPRRSRAFRRRSPSSSHEAAGWCGRSAPAATRT